MIKIAWWLRSVLLFHNSKFSSLSKGGGNNINEMKNKYVVGLVNVLVGRFVKLDVEGDDSGINRMLLETKGKLNGLLTNNNNNNINNNNNNQNNTKSNNKKTTPQL